MKDCTGMDVCAQAGSRRAVKKAVTVRVSFARAAGEAQTLEGPVPYRPGDALITGPAGEQWPVEREFFFRNYEPRPGVRQGDDGEYRRLAQPVWALRMREAFCVRSGKTGAPLQGASGDWLVQYGPDSYGAVRADIFPQLYEENMQP